jgi:Raf kinase inhibitor-like YbhB/YbcL family protein
MKVESPAFNEGKRIPKLYTCEGEDVSPPLIVTDIPKNAKSLVVIVDDPDAPNGTFDHWLAWNFPIKELIPQDVRPPVQGRNHFGETRYRGPCPPRGGPHRYYFKVFAVDYKLILKEGCTKFEVESAMKDHVVGKAHLMGVYQR